MSLANSLVLLVWLCFATASCLAANYGFQSMGRLEPDAFYSLHFKTLDGKDVSFDKFKNKIVMITNVASQCGYTEVNYSQLRKIKERLGEDFEVVLIPSNEFKQETGSDEEIMGFVTKAGGETYTVLAKSAVNGPQQHPLVELLKRTTKTEDKEIAWNFETKFIVSPDGTTVSRYSDAFEPQKLIESLKFYARNLKKAEL